MVGTSVRERLRQGAEALLARSAHEIALDKLELDPQQPRKTRDPEAAAELAASVRSQGIIQPLLVTQIPESDRYRIVFGERRYHAACDVGLKSVPCVVREKLDPLQVLVIQLTENLQREDPRPLEVATSLARLEDPAEFGLTRAEIARLLGRHPSWVTNTLSLLAKTGPARDALEEHYLRDHETTRLFERLPEEEKTALLSEARSSDLPIRRSAVRLRLAVASTRPESLDDPEEAPAGSTDSPSTPSAASAPPLAEQASTQTLSPPPSSSTPTPSRRGRPARQRRPAFVLPPLTWEELHRLFQLLELDVPSDPSELEEAFVRLRDALRPPIHSVS